MEKRAILAAVLMAALLIVYQTFFLPQGEQHPQKAPPEAPSTKSATPSPAPMPPAKEERPQESALPRSPRPAQKLARVESPNFVAVVSSEGGKLQEFNLRYRGDKPMVIVGSLGPAGLIADAGAGRQVVPFDLSDTAIVLGPERPTADLVLSGFDGDLRIRQTQQFEASE